MSSLAEFIPIELVNHILSFRPRHPDACLIKELKESVLTFENIDDLIVEELLDDDEELDSLTFNQLRYISSYPIFSNYFDGIMIELNKIIKIQCYIVKKKPSYFAKVDMFYWGNKYYTELNACNAFKKCCNHNDMIYKAYILVINIDTNEVDYILDNYINKKFYDRVEELDYDSYQQTIEYDDPDEMYDKLYDEMTKKKFKDY